MSQSPDSDADGESTATDELPVDVDELPNWWDVLQDPTNVDPVSFILEYGRNPPRSDPTATIGLLTPNTQRGRDDGYVVEVQDANANGPAMNYLNPQAVFEKYDDLDEAVSRIMELADEYPLAETRE